jgi:hypothetical protein
MTNEEILNEILEKVTYLFGKEKKGEDKTNNPFFSKRPVAPVVVPKPEEIDFSIYVSDASKPYHSYVQQFGGPKGLVENIMYNILLKDTFYAPIKEFMVDYPSFFPGVEV